MGTEGKGAWCPRVGWMPRAGEVAQLPRRKLGVHGTGRGLPPQGGHGVGDAGSCGAAAPVAGRLCTEGRGRRAAGRAPCGYAGGGCGTGRG